MNYKRRNNLMAISNLNQFLNNFFVGHNCQIISNQNGVLTIQLTEEMDRALMNRPFYWHYIKKMGQTGEPQTLTLITNKDKRKETGEFIHFGSPRLQQIMNHLKKNERFTKAFQKLTEVTTNSALHPWLVLNIKVTYIGKLQKDEVFSLGLNLINGMMKSQMMEYLYTLKLQNTIPDYCYTIAPIIKLHSGFKRIESVIKNYIENQEHDWANESLEKLEDEIELLKSFYIEPSEEEKIQMEKEITEIKTRYEPRIRISIINGGIFHLHHV